MEMTEPWLLVQEGSKLFLLAQDHQNYIFITVNKNLTAQIEDQLRYRTITPVLLKELGLTIRVLPKNQVRGVALTGSEAGEYLYFYQNAGKKLKYVFSDDYDKERADAFFAGMARFTPPKGGSRKKKDADDWRRKRQDPQLFEKLWFVSPVLTLLSFVCAFAYRMRGGWVLYLLSLLWVLIPVILDILFPAYFTLILEGKGEKKKDRNLLWPLLIHGWLMSIGRANNWLDGKLYLLVMLICGILCTVVMGIFAEEFRREKAYLIVVFLVTGVFGSVVAGRFNEALDFSEPETYTLTVEDLEYNGGRNRTYRCWATLPDGREAEMHIRADFYETLEIGDPIRVEVSTGALGIEYANAYPAETEEGTQ